MSGPGPAAALGTIARYSTSRIYRFVLRILTGFVRPLLLPPEMFGLWNLIVLVLQYADEYLHLGCRQAARFRLPYLWGRGELAEGERIKGTVRTGAMVAHLAGAGLLVAVALLGDWDGPALAGLLCAAAIVAISWYHEHLVLLLQSRQEFRPVIGTIYIAASGAFFLGTPMIWLFGVHGVFATALITEVVMLAYLRRHCAETSPAPFDFALYRALVGEGLPILGFDFASTLLRSADRLLIAAFLGTEQLGYYALAVFVFTALLEVPGAAREVLEPRMMGEAASLPPGDLLREYLFRPLVNTAFYIPLLIGPAVFAAPFIDLVLPRYVAGVAPAQVLAVGGYFLALSFVARGMIVANGWQVRALLPLAAAGLVNAGLTLLAIHGGHGIVGVAAAGSLSYLVLLALLLGLIRRRHAAAEVAWARTMLSLAWPFVLMAGLLALLLALPATLGLGRWMALGMQLVVYGAAMAAFLHMAPRFAPLAARPDWRALGRRLRRR